MNAGMFDEDGRPIGLAIVEGQIRARDQPAQGRRQFPSDAQRCVPGPPRRARKIVTGANWKPSPDIRIATQSGPMLVIDGKLHPAFDTDGSSRYIRNGVGIAPDGKPRFVISEHPVSLGKFARFFRNQLKCRNALFFDGAVSALWDPANARRDSTVPLGPIVVVFKSAASAPGRATPAKP